jgi:hypothetical protein
VTKLERKQLRKHDNYLDNRRVVEMIDSAKYEDRMLDILNIDKKNIIVEIK